jgi:hypothetical protein
VALQQRAQLRISAFGALDGGPRCGSALDRRVWLSKTQMRDLRLDARGRYDDPAEPPGAAIAVDSSNYRVAYLGWLPQPGHADDRPAICSRPQWRPGWFFD